MSYFNRSESSPLCLELAPSIKMYILLGILNFNNLHQFYTGRDNLAHQIKSLLSQTDMIFYSINVLVFRHFRICEY